MGKYLRKAMQKLNARIKAWEASGSNHQNGHKKPGSEKK
jgi:hypothetical protein